MSKPSGESEAARAVLPTLTSLRWYAALAVFFYHAGVYTGWRTLNPFGRGQSGVTFFFVLSGFVLTWSYRPGMTQRTFMWRRFSRIYPSHAVVFALTVVIGLVTHSLFTTPVLGIVLGFLVLQAWTVSPTHSYVYAGNSPSWSLSAEAFFYLCFLGLHRMLRKLQTIPMLFVTGVILVAGATATIVLARAGYGSTAAYNMPIVLLPQFILGITLALVVQRGLRLPYPWIVGGALFLVFLVLADHAPDYPFRNYVLLPGVAAMILAGATSDLQGHAGILTHPISLWLGQVSFAFYLVHQGTLIILLKVTSLGGGKVTALAFVVSLALAASLHHLVERPAQRALSNRRPFGRPGQDPHPKDGVEIPR